ncbi:MULTISPECIES: carboxymuconolactone decarboxylase family protein [unclassified Paraburkholderia]|uniref:carboxymuconolactone decarboxylase family protein n=1 Tax=unclassified Paraburkholderia TaxID=2615204 RepID=UPI0016199C4C|nr:MULTISPECIES: carboxymuconolactone decarboxylase family protein [unclassified Paraburkholderia]MBB5406098.1 AhpD family alkylhydroperoxidase [Paraburkholderia sp. HC6.4b]MBB5448494.1 AhpD family alkylhydroperoxidase [Paraburkholderia sp. Kb1A]MBB5457241.1 AhpD family alkylhydroperoxidase [Paraburkholderia sp. Cpub6]MBB5499141.1 AhpD family alkylhydroperoxidase [Paraburkholderia sp. MM5384-R2]MBC8721017.1 carboxymuconolactone decarboxylase family protein [Paraburkholderia sp. 31.1]
MEQRLDFYKANPAAIKSLLGVEERIGKSSLEKSLTELVRLRASQINGCAYCVDMHTADARKGGETERRLATVVVWRETPFFTDRERAALEWTEALTLVSHDHVPDAVWQAVRPHFSDEELVDLTLLVSAINAWNRFAISFRKMPA